MLQELLLLFGLAALPAAFSYFLDFCFGKPGSNEPNRKAIFFFYTYFLALRRVRAEKREFALLQAFRGQLESESPEVRKDGKDQLKLATVLTAQKLFTWEQAFGMCQFCCNFWVCMGFSLAFFNWVPLQFFSPLSFFLIIPIISHSILRKL